MLLKVMCLMCKWH